MGAFALQYNLYFESEECCSCHAPFMMTQDSRKRLINNHGTFWCPYCGTSQHYYGKTKEQKLKEELARERERKEAALRRANEANQRADEQAAKAEVATKSKQRIKNRIKHGICPCCNRTFKNLQRHMKTKHKDFVSNSESLKEIRESMELSQNKLAKSLDMQPGYISNYENNKYLPEYAKEILDKFVNENA